MPCVADVLTSVTPILAQIATIFPAVEAVLDAIAPLVSRRFSKCD
jgi:hypothetical protein